MKALALAAALVAIAGPALPRAAGFDAPSYGDGCRGSCPTYYADADSTIGSGDIPYGFSRLVFDQAPNRGYWAHRNSALVDPAKIMSTETAIKRYGLPALRGHPSAWGWYPVMRNGDRVLRPLPRPDLIKVIDRDGPAGGSPSGSFIDNSGDVRPSGYFLPIRAGAPAPRLPCGDEILLRFPGLDASSPALYQWMKAQPCGI
jgi:hypothetical protein